MVIAEVQMKDEEKICPKCSSVMQVRKKVLRGKTIFVNQCIVCRHYKILDYRIE